MAQSLALAVVGMPGHGKSTFLNALAGDRKAFATGSGSGSCTQEVSERGFDLEYQGQKFNVKLVDTMGFPDPNPKNAAGYYDSVISCCNKPLNAIVWLVKCDRQLHTLVAQYKVLMREFNNAAPPIVVVVNGVENYEDDEERDERKQQDLIKSYEFGQSIAKAAGISAQKVIPGAEKGDLKTRVKDQLAVSLLGTTPRASQMKTFSQLQEEMDACTSAEESAALEAQKQREAEAKAEQNIQDQKDHIASLRAWRAGLGWIPFVGVVSSVIIDAKIAEAEEYHGQLAEELVETERQRRDSVQNADGMTKRFKVMKETFESLRHALFG